MFALFNSTLPVVFINNEPSFVSIVPFNTRLPAVTFRFNLSAVDLMVVPAFCVNVLFANIVNVASAPASFTMSASTVIVPACEPAPSVVMFTFVPAFNAFSIVVFRITASSPVIVNIGFVLTFVSVPLDTMRTLYGSNNQSFAITFAVLLTPR